MRRTSHLDTNTDICAALAGFVAELTETDIDDMPRLVHTVDPDALEALRTHPFRGTVTFDWLTCHIIIDFSDPVFVTVSDITIDP